MLQMLSSLPSTSLHCGFNPKTASGRSHSNVIGLNNLSPSHGFIVKRGPFAVSSQKIYEPQSTGFSINGNKISHDSGVGVIKDGVVLPSIMIHNNYSYTIFKQHLPQRHFTLNSKSTQDPSSLFEAQTSPCSKLHSTFNPVSLGER